MEHGPKKWPEPGWNPLIFKKSIWPKLVKILAFKNTHIWLHVFDTSFKRTVQFMFLRGQKFTTEDIPHFLRQENRKSFPAGVWLTKRAGKKDFFLQSIVVRKIEGEMEGPYSSTEPLTRNQNVRKMGTMIVGRVVNLKDTLSANLQTGTELSTSYICLHFWNCL